MKDLNIIFEKDNNSLSTFDIRIDTDENKILQNIPDNLRNNGIDMPNISENEVVRHYIGLSNMNYGVDTGFYPLGSCTMKYNPKINEKISKYSCFLNTHPYTDDEDVQGNLEVLYKSKKSLLEITGMDDITLSPCAGAHGELTGLYIIKAYFKYKKQERPYILIPDSSHGTNPASTSMTGFKIITINSTEGGFVDIKDLENKANNKVAGIMLTNPNTLGLFEKDIKKIVEICSKHDIQLYYDGANLNAFLGIARPGDMGFDIVHMNLHKSFSTPHGGGGPGAGPVSVKKHLSMFLPGEDIIFLNNKYNLIKRNEPSIGKMRSFNSNFLIILRSYIYTCSLGKEGLSKTGLVSLLNANYLAALIKDYFNIATDDHIMHEFVLTLTNVCKEHDLTIIDFAKRILDYGYHSPTVSFPLIIHDCLMIEPTETETKATLEKFAESLIKILEEAKNDPDLLRNAPTKTPIRRPDEVTAARQPILKYEKE